MVISVLVLSVTAYDQDYITDEFVGLTGRVQAHK